MKITGSKQELALLLKGERALGRTIGFVPTMGALHEGHLSLVSEAVARYDVCVVSIFVNPKQFNNPQDLITYPRQPEQDIALLEKTGCHYLFMPSEEEVYEKDAIERVFDLGAVAQVMEGVRRPGHFEGVALIVSKLFEWVAPDGAFFGEKDFQQIAIIRTMIKQCGLDLELIPMPIVREASGLALSSRNQRLTEETRPYAPLIYQILRESLLWKSEGKTPKEIEERVVQKLNAQPHLEVEYYSIVNAETLQPITHWEEAPSVIGCIACYCGDVRLIDNIFYSC